MKIPRTLLEKYNKPGPRYTSYPPANFFNTNFGKDDYRKAIIDSNKQQPSNISLYVHIPFCPRLCFFCGCNTSAFISKSEVEKYIESVKKEIRNVAGFLDKNRKVTQVHWGGGTPNSIPVQHIGEIMDLFRELFIFAENPEIAIECNPAYLDEKKIDALKELGFNRFSLGIQDFDEQVLKTVNRALMKKPVEALMDQIRINSDAKVNLDFIYGLPGQTKDSFLQSVKKAVSLNPDRLVTFSYAHVPWVKSAQKHLEKAGLPSPEEKLEMLESSYQLLTTNGYESIGMDHYAKPGDELARALKTNTLHRNFQGYCTREHTGQVYGFGATSISQLTKAYSQNTKEVKTYMQMVDDSGFATEKGITLGKNEEICRHTIQSLMCNKYLDLNEVAGIYSISTNELMNLLKFDPAAMNDFISDGLAEWNNGIIEVTETGQFFIRNIAMLLDPQLDTAEGKYSKTV